MRAVEYLYNKLVVLKEVNYSQHGLDAPFFKLIHSKSSRDEWIKISYRNYLYKEEGRRIAELLISNNIQYSWLKGLYLIDNVYEHDTARPMSDLDIFLFSDQESKWDEILKNMNFKRIPKQTKLGPHKIEYLKEINGEKVCLEVHTALYYELHGRKDCPGDFPNSKEEHFVFLVFHYLRQHCGGRLIWLLDILMMSELCSLDWKRVKVELEKRNLKNTYQLLQGSVLDFDFLERIYPLRKWQVNLFKVTVRSWRYYWIKCYSRGVRATVYYNFLWLQEKLINKT